MSLECCTGYENSGLCKSVSIPGRQVEYYFKIDQNVMIAIILHGSFLSATGFRLVNCLLGERRVKQVWKGKCGFLRIHVHRIGNLVSHSNSNCVTCLENRF